MPAPSNLSSICPVVSCQRDRKHMHRFTARLLLTFVLVGTLAPVALAISAPPPHVCCMRKPLHNHGSHDSELRAAGGERHNCCPPLTTAQAAQLGAGVDVSVSLLSVKLPAVLHPVFRTNDGNSLDSVRGPPSC